MEDKDIKHLEWVYERMINVHNENENCDYMIRFREILETLRQPAVEVQNEQLVSFCRWYNQTIPSYETTEEEIVETYLRESN